MTGMEPPSDSEELEPDELGDDARLYELNVGVRRYLHPAAGHWRGKVRPPEEGRG